MKKIAKKHMHHLLPVILSLLLVTTIVVTVETVQMIREEIFDKQSSIANQVKTDLDYRFSQHEEFANTIMLAIRSDLNSQDTSYSQEYAQYANITNQLSVYLDRGMIADIHLYVPDEKMYSTQRDLLYPLSDLTDESCITPGIHWLETQRVRISVDEEINAIACVQTMNKSTDYSALAGVLCLYISVDSFDAVFSANSSLTGELFLVNQDGRTLIHPESEYLGDTILTESEIRFLNSGESGCRMIRSNLISYSRLQSTSWYVVVRTPMASSWGISSTGIVLLIALWLITILFFIFIVMMLMNNAIVGDAISHLQSMISEMLSNDNPQGPANALHKRHWISNSLLHDEMEATVQSMARTIEKRYEEQLELANYQMQSLQSQIKPHFLYNTLDVIKWMVVEGNYSDSIWTINALSKYLRMSINRDSNLVTLREEIELAEIYLDIIKKRFAGRFRINFDLEDAAMDCAVPRLILQPIVENSLIHGLLYCEKPDARLEIRAWIEGGKLCIDIEDNGSGMEPQTLDALRQKQKSKHGGYGLQNIRMRLAIFGGNSASLQIYSQPGSGSCVSIQMPCRMLEDTERQN